MKSIFLIGLVIASGLFAGCGANVGDAFAAHKLNLVLSQQGADTLEAVAAKWRTLDQDKKSQFVSYEASKFDSFEPTTKVEPTPAGDPNKVYVLIVNGVRREVRNADLNKFILENYGKKIEIAGDSPKGGDYHPPAVRCFIFSTADCEPCRLMASNLRAACQQAGFTIGSGGAEDFQEIDVNSQPGLASRYSIPPNYPALVMVDLQGKELSRAYGTRSPEAMFAWLTQTRQWQAERSILRDRVSFDPGAGVKVVTVAAPGPKCPKCGLPMICNGTFCYCPKCSSRATSAAGCACGCGGNCGGTCGCANCSCSRMSAAGCATCGQSGMRGGGWWQAEPLRRAFSGGWYPGKGVVKFFKNGGLFRRGKCC